MGPRTFFEIGELTRTGPGPFRGDSDDTAVVFDSLAGIVEALDGLFTVFSIDGDIA